MEGSDGRAAPNGLRATGNLNDRYIEAIVAAVRHSQRPATRRAYAGAWKRFRTWAEAEGGAGATGGAAHRGGVPCSPGGRRAVDGIAGHGPEGDQSLSPCRGPRHAHRGRRCAPDLCRAPQPGRRRWEERAAPGPRTDRRGARGDPQDGPACRVRDPRAGPSRPSTRGAGAMWTSRSRRSCAMRCSGVPKRRRSGGGRWPFARTGRRG